MKGIAGNIIEVSVLGCKQDNKQEPDILVDGELTEIKTTGMVKPKKADSPYKYECKEPVSVTAVSIPVIVNEEFETSNFWHKLAHMLWVYYHYNSTEKVKLEGYKNFPILGYQFYKFTDNDKIRLRQDWLLVRDYLIVIQAKYKTEDERKEQYPKLSSELRGQLMLIDTAPKFPNSPRFRLKRSFATTIAASCFTKPKLAELPIPITKYSDIDDKCKQLTEKYKGKSFEEIAESLGIVLSVQKKNMKEEGQEDEKPVSVKNFAELVVLKMFGSEAKSLNRIADFYKIGLIAKSLPLDSKGTPKESMKMYTPDFKELMDEGNFSDSFMRDYFSQHQFLLIVYQYTHPDRKNKDPKYIKFVGFKRAYLSDGFIDTAVWKFWYDVRHIIQDKKLRIIKEFNNDGTPKINKKSRTQREAPNFPKEGIYDVFMRGSASTAEDSSKTLVINGLKMLPQEVWLSKRVTLQLFKNTVV